MSEVRKIKAKKSIEVKQSESIPASRRWQEGQQEPPMTDKQKEKQMKQKRIMAKFIKKKEREYEKWRKEQGWLGRVDYQDKKSHKTVMTAKLRKDSVKFVPETMSEVEDRERANKSKFAEKERLRIEAQRRTRPLTANLKMKSEQDSVDFPETGALGEQKFANSFSIAVKAKKLVSRTLGKDRSGEKLHFSAKPRSQATLSIDRDGDEENIRFKKTASRKAVKDRKREGKKLVTKAKKAAPQSAEKDRNREEEKLVVKAKKAASRSAEKDRKKEGKKLVTKAKKAASRSKEKDRNREEASLHFAVASKAKREASQLSAEVRLKEKEEERLQQIAYERRKAQLKDLQLLGDVQYNFNYLQFMMEREQWLEMPNGRSIQMNIVPCDKKGKKLSGVIVNNPKELINKQIYFNVQIHKVVGLHTNVKDTFCQYKLFFEDESTTTKMCQGIKTTAYYQFSRKHTIPCVTRDILKKLENSFLTVRLYGYPSWSYPNQ